MFIEGLYAYIIAQSSITALLGTSRSDGTTGVFSSLAKEQTPVPFIVMQQVSGMPLQESFDGTGALQECRWRFSCYGADYKSAKNLANVLRLSLISLDGVLPGGHGQVQGAWHRLEMDEVEAMLKGTLYSTHIDFEFNYLDV